MSRLPSARRPRFVFPRPFGLLGRPAKPAPRPTRLAVTPLEDRLVPTTQPFHLADSITVPAGGTSVTTAVTLQSGVKYLVVVSGDITATDSASFVSRADAEFAYNPKTGPAAWADDSIGYGVRISGATGLPSTTSWWSDPCLNHTYRLELTGNGSALTAWYNGDTATVNTGNLQVDVYLASDAPGAAANEPGDDQGPLDAEATYCVAVGQAQDEPGWATVQLAAVADGNVSYPDGTVRFQETDLQSNADGLPWGHGRTWTNDPGFFVGCAPQGAGVTVDEAPHLVLLADGSVAIVTGGATARYFDPNGSGGFTPRRGRPGTLAHAATPDTYVFTDGAGNRFEFDGFSSLSNTRPAGAMGQMTLYTAVNGSKVFVHRDGNGRLDWMGRGSDTAPTEKFEYDYYASGVNAGLLESVTQTRGSTVVRVAAYTYHDGSTAAGNAGTLRTATVYDGDPAAYTPAPAITTSYYRYYKAGEAGGYNNGLKFVVTGAAYERMMAAVVGTTTNPDDVDASADPSPLTDPATTIDDFADRHYKYDPASHQVVSQAIQGLGCSVCSGGVGVYTYAYAASGFAAGPNSWATKTVETLPDGTVNTVYANAVGQVIVKATTPVGSASEWVTYTRYDSNSRPVLAAQPSAVETPIAGQHAYNEQFAELLPSADSGTEGRVNTTTANDQNGQNVAVQADGSYLVVWQGDSTVTSSKEVYAQRYTAAGAKLGGEFQVNTYTYGDQYSASVAALPDGRYVVAYNSWGFISSVGGANDYDGYAIVYRIVDFSGGTSPTMTAEALANVTTTSWQVSARVAADAAGHFVIGWQSYGQAATWYSVHARQFAYTATAVTPGSELTVGGSTFFQDIAAVAAQPDGRFAVMWREQSSSSATLDVRMRAYDGSASPTAASYVVTQTTADDQGTPWLTANPAGGYVAAWHSMWQSGDGYLAGVYARRLDADAAPVGNEFQVNTYTTDQQVWPTVAVEGSGEFLVAWMSYGQDGSSSASWGAYAQRFTAAGAKNGSEFRLSTTTADEQMFPAVGVDWAGNYVAVWESVGQDGSGAGVYGRNFRFDRSGLRDNAGLVMTTAFAAATTADDDTPGDVAGYARATYLQNGEAGTPVPQSLMLYYAHQDAQNDAWVHPVASTTRFALGTDTVGASLAAADAETTEYQYTWVQGAKGDTNQWESVLTTLPAVATAHLGSGKSDTTLAVADTQGRVAWTVDAVGILSYSAYDAVTGATTLSVTDVQRSKLPYGATVPDIIDDVYTGTTIGLTGLHLATTTAVDAQGRVTAVTEPNGRVTYAMYDDAAHMTQVFPGWHNAGTSMSPAWTTSGPVQVTRHDWAGGYTESLSVQAGATTVGVPSQLTLDTSTSLTALARTFVNAAGQAVAAHRYARFGDASVPLVYSADTVLMTAASAPAILNTDYYATNTQYDDRGRVKRVESALGTISRTVYDGLGRVVSMWVGTDDSPTTDYWSPTNTAGTNLVMVAANEYDGGSVGDGNLTIQTSYPHDGTADRVTMTWYDWRDRAIAVKHGVEVVETTGVNRPLVYTTLDNLGRATATALFDGDGVSLSTISGVPQSPTVTLRRALVTTLYDERGRAYQQTQWNVDGATGAATAGLHTNTWHDAAGRRVKQVAPGGMTTKNKYDGAGRLVCVTMGDMGGDTTWADAFDLTDDTVLEQAETDYSAYDADGGPVVTIFRQRFHDATGTGELGNSTSTASPQARVSYTAEYTDAGDRPIAQVNFGTFGGASPTIPTTPPARPSDALTSGAVTVLITSSEYGGDGHVSKTVDPRGIEMRMVYDALGRVTRRIEGYVDGVVSATDDRVTDYAYDGSDHLVLYRAWSSDSTSQDTAYTYGVGTSTPGGGSALWSNDLLWLTTHPTLDKYGTGPGGTPDRLRYNALGEVIRTEDRNGTTHDYVRDVVGRTVSDAATAGTGVDSTVLTLTTAYDGAGQAYLFTSYGSSTAKIVNQVQRDYNGLGQLVAEYQEHSGAVTVSTAPAVRYTYTEMDGGANHSRLAGMTYPDGTTIDYQYITDIDAAVSRVTRLRLDDTRVERYGYLGLGTVVVRSHNSAAEQLSYVRPVGSSDTGDGGDQYTGLDRFGRVVDQRWEDESGVVLDEFAYGYDANGNRLYRQSLLNNDYDELYHASGAGEGYDRLDQLTDYLRGALSMSTVATTYDTVASAKASQGWTMDGVGNFTGVTTGSTTVNRTHDKRNELLTVGSDTLTYSAAGEMTTDDSGRTFTYDAWGRTVTVGGTARYAYDAFGRRVAEGTHAMYYSKGWQVVEERWGTAGDVYEYVWSPVYIDAMVARVHRATGVAATWTWVQQDANWNVTSLTDGDGTVLQRFAYDPYGQSTVLSAAWAATADAYNWAYMHQGGRYDAQSGQYAFRFRDYSPTLMRWTRQDPKGFDAGDNNVYRYLGNQPSNLLDPLGLDCRKCLIGGGEPKGPERAPSCGPDVTDWFKREIDAFASAARAAKQRFDSAFNRIVAESFVMGILWFDANIAIIEGARLLEFSYLGRLADYKVRTARNIEPFDYSFCKDPDAGTERETVTLCGVCLTTNQLGNIIFGVVAREMGLIRQGREFGRGENNFLPDWTGIQQFPRQQEPWTDPGEGYRQRAYEIGVSLNSSNLCFFINNVADSLQRKDAVRNKVPCNAADCPQAKFNGPNTPIKQRDPLTGTNGQR